VCIHLQWPEQIQPAFGAGGEVEERQEREGGGYPGRVRCRRPKAETDPPKPRERKTKTENRKPKTENRPLRTRPKTLDPCNETPYYETKTKRALKSAAGRHVRSPYGGPLTGAGGNGWRRWIRSQARLEITRSIWQAWTKHTWPISPSPRQWPQQP
jgi:hypothetical protein